MYNIADESVQFSPTQLFIQSRRGCSASNGQGVQLGRYIQSKITAGRLYPYYTFSHRELILLRQIYIIS